MELLSSLKEMKNVTLSKILLGTLILSIVVFLTEFFSPDAYQDFIQAMRYFSEKTEFNKWGGDFSCS
ncbi:hypothetical protein [Paenibacillus polymyxa]|uniref:hypothetical protein n=1 Tax=Paenibacillus polymyxa TaxID=1406 RepID=UPI000C9F57AF|nr:hypothetical protein [Paenibacillus polymyxa]PNQ85226.1 hypothetical protein C1T20_13070 [Paenibacillus polymyxa]